MRRLIVIVAACLGLAGGVSACVPASSAGYISLSPCGGAYPPCSVAQHESGGDYGVVNWGGCDGHNCYGKWQFSGAWAGQLGLPGDLRTATPTQ